MWTILPVKIAQNQIVFGVKMRKDVWTRMHILQASLMDNVVNGQRLIQNAILRKRERNGARFIHLVQRVDLILDVDGVMTVLGQEKDYVCQVELVVQALKAWTLAQSNDGILQNVLVSAL